MRYIPQSLLLVFPMTLRILLYSLCFNVLFYLCVGLTLYMHEREMCVGERETQRQCVGTFVNGGLGRSQRVLNFLELELHFVSCQMCV